MREFLVKFFVVTGTVAILAGTGLGVKSCMNAREVARLEAIEAKKVEQHKKNLNEIQAMITLCDFARLSDEEQAKIDKCGDDVELAKRCINNIIDVRITFWKQI